MASTLRIIFEINEGGGIYFPTQFVSGTVELKAVKEIKKTRGLRLLIEGKATVKWSEPTGRSATSFEGDESFLNSIAYLFGEANGKPLMIPAGIHTYNFRCQLPSLLPPSAEGSFGHIRYKVHANLDIPWGFDLKTAKTFTVARYEDLNDFPELKLPCEEEVIETYCSFVKCCKSEPLILIVRMSSTGFAVGEQIRVNVELVNESSVKVPYSTFSLIRIEHFSSQCPSSKNRIKKEIISELRSLGVRAGQRIKFRQLVDLPNDLAITNVKYCNIFQITYLLRIKAHADGFGPSPALEVPITIGSVGLIQDNSSNCSFASLHAQDDTQKF